MLAKITKELQTRSTNIAIADASGNELENEIVAIKAKCLAHLITGGGDLPRFLLTWAELDTSRLGEGHLEIVLRKALSQNKTFQDWVKSSLHKNTWHRRR